MVGPDGSGDDVIISSREFKRMGLEKEVIVAGETKGIGHSLGSSELHSAETTRLPVVAVGRDFNGEDGIRAELGLEEV